ncbi:uncharacterized protein LOC127244520 isoform X2 [Andrographis paniculata]|uniref:uncharacterized protein LOC127244520 isoform X2 n=1 Tax=Andrographis paniculata TaxID=175694 RepID=UPI0021E98ACE|nr:uncharacterized protein LOC127244520 isoform X2 [Andrographis paniculata]
MGKLMFIAFLLLGLTLLSSSMLQVPVMASHGRGRGSSTYNVYMHILGRASQRIRSRQPQELPMPIAMYEEVQQDTVPQTLHVLLPEVLQNLPLRPTRLLWQQGSLPLLQ